MPQDAAEPLPGIIVIHEWWGLNDNIKAMTRRLAGEGYVALAVDLYGGATAETPEAAQALMSALLAEPDAARNNLRQAYDYLEKYAFAPRIASIGWCLGGGWSLQTALLYPDALDAMVMYYGQVVTDRDRLAPLNVPVLGFFGAEDESIPVRDVQEFRSTLMDLGKNAEVLIVPRADHAFANPSGGNYNEQAANEAWDDDARVSRAASEARHADAGRSRLGSSTERLYRCGERRGKKWSRAAEHPYSSLRSILFAAGNPAPSKRPSDSANGPPRGEKWWTVCSLPSSSSCEARCWRARPSGPARDAALRSTSSRICRLSSRT